MNRYVFTRHTPEQFRDASAHVAKHQPGDGLRAALPLLEGNLDFTHVYAFQGIDSDALDAHESNVVMHPTSATFVPCSSIPCMGLMDKLTITPMTMPPFRCYALLWVELNDGAIEGFEPPVVQCLTAGIPVQAGARVLVQLGDDDESTVTAAIEAWEGTPGVRAVTRFRASGLDLVRSPHT